MAARQYIRPMSLEPTLDRSYYLEPAHFAREKERIFSPGYGRHTGYGLFLVREILGITGATIRETGQEGKGAVFEITIPGGGFQVGDTPSRPPGSGTGSS